MFSLNNATEIGAIIALVLDWKQTLKIARSGGVYYEKNPILGKHPSVAEVNRYFVAVIIAEIVAYKLLNNTNSEILAAGTLAVETWQVLQNKKIGL